jgi:hypothetical protein
MAMEWLLQRNAGGDNQIAEFHIETHLGNIQTFEQDGFLQTSDLKNGKTGSEKKKIRL